MDRILVANFYVQTLWRTYVGPEGTSWTGYGVTHGALDQGTSWTRDIRPGYESVNTGRQ